MASAPAFQAGDFCEFESRQPLQNLASLLWKSSEPACDSPANVDWHKIADEDLCSAAMSEGVRACTGFEVNHSAARFLEPKENLLIW